MVREIKVKPVLNGYVVSVGCQEIVFTNLDVLCDEMKRYYSNPQNTENDYLENAINKNQMDVAEVAETRTNRLSDLVSN